MKSHNLCTQGGKKRSKPEVKHKFVQLLKTNPKLKSSFANWTIQHYNYKTTRFENLLLSKNFFMIQTIDLIA